MNAPAPEASNLAAELREDRPRWPDCGVFVPYDPKGPTFTSARIHIGSARPGPMSPVSLCEALAAPALSPGILGAAGPAGAASLAGSLASSAGELVAARAVMGLSAAMIFPSTLSQLTNVFTGRRERAVAIGLWGATTGVGIATGPIIGG